MRLEKGSYFPNFVFETEDSNVNNVQRAVRTADKTVFWVLRYIGCPTCRFDVHQIMLNYEKFQAAGAQVYVVMQSDPAIVRRDLEGVELPFHIICDRKQEFYSILEIKATETPEERNPVTEEDKAKLAAKIDAVRACGFVHGDYEGNEQQLPAIFVTDKEGMVLYSHYAENKIDMPTVDETLALLETL